MTSANTNTDQELREQVAHLIYKDSPDIIDDFVALIAQREQAAELRGRYDERFKILNRISTMRVDVSSDAIRNGRVEIMHLIADRLRVELQATKPEKGGLEI